MAEISCSVTLHRMSACLRKVPTPVQGASIKTASYVASLKWDRCVASWQNTSFWTISACLRREIRSFVRDWSTSRVSSAICLPKRESATFCKRRDFVPRPAPISKNLSGKQSGTAKEATFWAAPSLIASDPFRSRSITNSLPTSLLRAKRKHDNPQSFCWIRGKGNIFIPWLTRDLRVWGPLAWAWLIIKNKGAEQLEFSIKWKAESKPNSSISFWVSHWGNPKYKLTALTSEWMSPKGNSVFCSHARLKAKFATPAALGAKLRTSSTPSCETTWGGLLR